MNRLLPPELGLSLVLVLLIVLTAWIALVRYSGWTSRWILAGLGLRLAGSMVFLYGIAAVYGGGDYQLYSREGIAYANEIMGGPHAYFVTGDTWWGTTFISRLAGFLFLVIGPTLPGSFLVFSTMGFFGTLAFWTAARRAFPALDVRTSLIWLMAFPSLWFWPSSLGKDSIILLGLGLTVLGFVGARGRTGWATLLLGLFLVFVIRPQMTAVLVLALVAGQSLATLRSGMRGGGIRIILLVAAAVGTLFLVNGALGFELFNVDATTAYIEARASNTSYGGSAISDDVPVWLAPVTTLFRPFIWEANGPTAFVAAMETTFLWGMIWYRRRRFVAFFRTYRYSPMMWMGIVFVAVYAIAVGLSVANLGTLVRQRIHLLPFLLLPLAGLRRPARPRRVAAPTPLLHLADDLV